MPSPRDLTGDLVRLRKRAPLHADADGDEPAALVLRMRRMAPDPVLWLSGLVIILGLAVQGAFIAWMW